MANYTGTLDGHGQDLVLVDGDTISGNFLNMGHVIVRQGAHVKVMDASTPQFDSGYFLNMEARSFIVEGVLDASGYGFGGGGGAGANCSVSDTYGAIGLGGKGGDGGAAGDGQPGVYLLLATGRDHGAVGGYGGGPEHMGYTFAFGGLPGVPPLYQYPAAIESLRGGHGGYFGRGINGDTSTDELVWAGGGGAGGSSSQVVGIPIVGSYQLGAAAAGGQGGYGGGWIKVVSKQIIVGRYGMVLSKAIKGGGAGGSNGVAGGGGGGRHNNAGGDPGSFSGFAGGTGGTKNSSGQMGQDGPGTYLSGNPGAPGEGAWCAGIGTHTPDTVNNYDRARGGSGGEGAGGGILFKALPGMICGPQIAIYGSVSNEGGLGVLNGGTFKCFYTGNAVLPTENITTGRLYLKKTSKGVTIM